MPSAPERTCVGCRRRRPQRELIRCVLTADGRAVVGRAGAGRGAWLCTPPHECYELAVRRKAFSRAWRRPVGGEVLACLARELGIQPDDAQRQRGTTARVPAAVDVASLRKKG